MTVSESARGSRSCGSHGQGHQSSDLWTSVLMFAALSDTSWGENKEPNSPPHAARVLEPDSIREAGLSSTRVACSCVALPVAPSSITVVEFSPIWDKSSWPPAPNCMVIESLVQVFVDIHVQVFLSVIIVSTRPNVYIQDVQTLQTRRSTVPYFLHRTCSRIAKIAIRGNKRGIRCGIRTKLTGKALKLAISTSR